jgi:hypothetical protein
MKLLILILLPLNAFSIENGSFLNHKNNDKYIFNYTYLDRDLQIIKSGKLESQEAAEQAAVECFDSYVKISHADAAMKYNLIDICTNPKVSPNGN